MKYLRRMFYSATLAVVLSSVMFGSSPNVVAYYPWDGSGGFYCPFEIADCKSKVCEKKGGYWVCKWYTGTNCDPLVQCDPK